VRVRRDNTQARSGPMFKPDLLKAAHILITGGGTG
jgi:hypothetical protein